MRFMYWGVCAVWIGLAGHTAQAALSKTLVTSGLSSPLFVTAPASDSARIFIVERAGSIKIFVADSLNPVPFLNIQSKAVSGDEQGLLGLAFHPHYELNGYFYVNYTAKPDGRTRVSRFSVSAGNPEVADTAETVLLEVPQFQANHNGGMIGFGPNDGYLYIGMGDGGSSGDPDNRAQNPDSLLGKMLRIDVNTVPYSIPADNPFVLPDTARHEIWALGLRNPWRWSFDRANGDLYIGDVGQGEREEIDWQAASSAGGENYGWRRKEGFSCYNPSSQCDTLGVLTDPITQYLQSSGRCAITGGYVYRGCVAPEVFGHYFYGDYCTGEVWSFRYDGASILDSTNRTAALGMGSFNLASFGEDARGELYLVGIGTGSVWRLTSSAPPDSCTATCPVARTGDVDTSGAISSADIIYLVNFVFKAGPAPRPIPEAGDVNCTGAISSADIIYLVNSVFKGGPSPCDVCTLL
jgi:glucose/arabinose dehydrogenase